MSATPASAGGWGTLFQRPTPEAPRKPSASETAAKTVGHAATRLDAAYRRQMEAVSKARAEEAALLCTILAGVRAALPALVSPLLLLDVSARGRPSLLHLRALPLFGNAPQPRTASPGPMESLFLLEDGTFLRVRFTGATTLTDEGRLALAADRLEGIDVRHVLRDHQVEEVAAVLQRALSHQTTRREAQARDAAAYVARLQALRLLLTPLLRSHRSLGLAHAKRGGRVPLG